MFPMQDYLFHRNAKGSVDAYRAILALQMKGFIGKLKGI